MFNIGEKYILNIKKICDFFDYSSKNQLKETEITDNYVQDGNKIDLSVPSTKSIREIKTAGNAQIDSIKYDLVKTLLLEVISYDDTEIESDSKFPFGLEIAINTLIKEGFLIKINE